MSEDKRKEYETWKREKNVEGKIILHKRKERNENCYRG